MIAYTITNRLNGKRYVGITQQVLAKRWSGHKWDNKRGLKGALYNAMRLHGVENFTVEPVASALPHLGRAGLCDLERVLIAQEGTHTPAGYNMTAGGDGVALGTPNTTKGKPRSEEFKQKLRLAWSRDPERKVVHTAKFKGAQMSDASREKMRAAALKPERIEALRRRNATMNQSDEHKTRLKAAWARSPERRGRAADVMRRVMEQHRSTSNV